MISKSSIFSYTQKKQVMKKLLLTAAIAACLAMGNSARAQMVGRVRLTDITSDYIQVKAIRRTFSDKVWVSLEYGQNVPYLEDSYIKDDDGKKMEFDSALSFVNKAKAYGYELFQVFSQQNGSDSSLAVYVLKRK